MVDVTLHEGISIPMLDYDGDGYEDNHRNIPFDEHEKSADFLKNYFTISAHIDCVVSFALFPLDS